MRIPEEPVFRFFTPKRRQSPTEEEAAEPVDASAAGRDALARERGRIQREKAAEAEAAEAARTRTFEQQRHAGDDRRKNDRRKRQVDVLLDTRTGSRRQRAIDVKA